jgi:uncharacterized tellurite resistance protein B-like protein
MRQIIQTRQRQARLGRHAIIAPVLTAFKEWFDRMLPPPGGAGAQSAAGGDEHLLQLATAVMLVEVMRADPGLRADERDAVRAALVDKFALAPDEAAQLAQLGEERARAATDLFEFTSRINERFEMPAKLRMVEHMWRVAYADGHLSAHERHVMWRIADLLHVPQGAYQHARLRARPADEAGTGGG